MKFHCYKLVFVYNIARRRKMSILNQGVSTMKKVLTVCWSAAAAVLVAGESIIPDVTNKLWTSPLEKKVLEKSVEIGPRTGHDYSAIGFRFETGVKDVYEMTCLISAKNAPAKEDHFRWQINGMPYATDEVSLPAKPEKYRTFIFNNDLGGQKWLTLFYKYKSGGTANAMVVSDFKLMKVDVKNLKSVTLNEPCAWQTPDWSKFAVLSSEPVTDFIEEGDAITLSVGDDVKAGAVAWILSSFFPFDPDSEYEISAWIKTDVPGNVSLGVNSWIDNRYKHYWTMTGFQVTTEWKLYKTTIKTPSVAEQPVFELARTRGAVCMKVGDGAKKVYIRNWTATKK